MEYYFDNLDPTKFQRLANAILVARFGEDIRLTPLRGRDGGRDGETAPLNPFCEFNYSGGHKSLGSMREPRQGRYLFQMKHHRMVDANSSEVRRKVIADFRRELKHNVLSRAGAEKVNFFILITNVPSSEDALARLDALRRSLLANSTDLHADIWWGERVVALLDLLPSLWHAFPEMFPGAKIPFLGHLAAKGSGLSRAVRIALEKQYRRDTTVKFRQIELENSLAKLFIDLDLELEAFESEEQLILRRAIRHRREAYSRPDKYDGSGETDPRELRYYALDHRELISAMSTLLFEEIDGERFERVAGRLTRQILIEGGPGQGKSTLVQTVAQVYRFQLLQVSDPTPVDPFPPLEAEGRWIPPAVCRLPLRVELRLFADWLTRKGDGSVEEYLADLIKRDAGGSEVSVDDIHSMVEESPTLLIFDGLDEVASDEMRGEVLAKITECMHRFESILHSDLRVIITTRPPAIAGHQDSLIGFSRFRVASLTPRKVDRYRDRWISAQLRDPADIDNVRSAFERRREEPHVSVLTTNAMQLSILLNFIHIFGEAFPDRKAELYRDYFQIVIKRDIEKNAEFRNQREKIEALHEFLGFEIHALTEAERADGSLTRPSLIKLVAQWLKDRGSDPQEASRLFRLGEERLGLVFALKGQGDDTAYGFEVQPVREYFAAAFIHHQIIGDAHAVFESMIRRPYWQEVALFLAGLSRPNEKADLVARARSLDRDTALGWRNDGRKITLALLQEGVYSEPPYVFADALDFVLECFDRRLIPAQSAPSNLLTVLPSLILQAQGGEKSQEAPYATQLTCLAQETSFQDDEYSLFRLFGVLCHILAPNAVRALLMSYAGSNPRIRAKTRLTWPYRAGISMRSESENRSYWEEVPDSMWANEWWKTALRFPEATDLRAPESLHQLLLYRLASSPMFPVPPNYAHDAQTKLHAPLSRWAVWQLAWQFQVLMLPPKAQQSLSTTDSPLQFPRYDDSQVDYSGLQHNCRDDVASLLEGTRRVVAARNSAESDGQTAITDYMELCSALLDKEGLSSWLGFRAASVLFNASRYFNLDPDRKLPASASRRLGPFRGSFELLSASPHFEGLCMRLERYFEDSNVIAYFGHRLEKDPLHRTLILILEGVSPTRIRTNHNTLSDVSSLLAKSCAGDDIHPLDWLLDLTYSTAIVRNIADECSECLPEMLRFLSTLGFHTDWAADPLRTPTMQRVLKIARTTDDARTLDGALVALSTSRFLRIAGPELVVKLLRANHIHDAIGAGLFRQAMRPLPRSDLKETAEDTRILSEAATRIVASPIGFPLRVVISAADFLAWYSSVDSKPLLAEASQLRISVRDNSNQDCF